MEQIFVPEEILINILSYNLVPRLSRVCKTTRIVEQKMHPRRVAHMDSLYPGWNGKPYQQISAVEKMILARDSEAIKFSIRKLRTRTLLSKIRNTICKEDIDSLSDILFSLPSYNYLHSILQYKSSKLFRLYLRDHFDHQQLRSVIHSYATSRDNSILEWLDSHQIDYDRKIIQIILRHKRS